ncbi:hypothetical protein BGW38_006422 [Lunasporangiospora selenospora]|uniref:Uncharacterized protein n=1 Tax=Lunasporangiospora selenospora TaxID=979761 RepID=A0A9P6FZ16_9FUNG|nr:hypothetical protein BGW38_006422 [Lunasporangiospora selenospora]
MAGSEQDRLLLACPCLNVKLHVAKEPEAGSSPIGKELQLGLAGVSVEQKILCSLSISQGLATVRCINCDQDVYTFKPSSSSVILEPISLAFITSSVLFSPSNGIVVPSDATVSGTEIASIRTDPYYSIAFRLVLPPPTNELSTPTASTTSTTSLAPAPPQAQQQQQQQQHSSRTYRPHLEKIRTIMDKELESNITAQQLKTEARIEAYKSQQLNALQKSIEATRLEKERLWTKIQDRVSSPPAASAGSDAGLSPHADGSGFLDPNSMATTSLHPFDVPSTMPVRFTSASYVQGAQGAFLDRRKASISEAAMSNQLREFEQRLASNSMRRQSIAPAIITETTSAEMNTITLANVSLTTTPLTASEAGPSMGEIQSFALSSSHASGEVAQSHGSDSARTSPTPKSKKKVTIVEAISIVEPEGTDDDNVEPEEDTDEGVVFDLDEELGFGDPEEAVFEIDEESDSDLSDAAEDDDDDVHPLANGVSAMNISKSLPKHGRGTGDMIVGSLRANYLRRQKNLEQHRRSLKEDLEFERSDDDGDDDDDDDNGTDNIPAALRFGTSLPIQILPRPANLPKSTAQGRLPLPQHTITTTNSSLALPPGSSPAAAMLQRRLSRAYGPDVDSEIGTSTRVGQHSGNSNLSTLASSLYAGSLRETSILPSLSATPGTVIIDPLMLLEEEHDADDREDQLRKHRQPFSSINHRRDQQELQESAIQFINENGQNSTESIILGSSTTAPIASGTITTATATAMSTTARSTLRSSSFSAQADFEPPHLYSARTYVGSTPWEMPTRVTVKSSGMREGSQLDRQIALEMAKEIEKEKQEKAAEAAAAALQEGGSSASDEEDGSAGRYEATRRVVEKIDETEEEEDEEDAEAKRIRESLLPPQAVPMPRDQDEETPTG